MHVPRNNKTPWYCQNKHVLYSENEWFTAIPYFSAHCISDQELRTIVVRSVQKVYFRPLILGKNLLVRSVQKLCFWPNSVVKNDQNFWPLLWSQNVVSNYNMTCRLRVEWKAAILAKGQNSCGQKCTKSVFLTTNFGREYLGQKCTKTPFLIKFSGQKWPTFLPTNIVSKCCVKL